MVNNYVSVSLNRSILLLFKTECEIVFFYYMYLPVDANVDPVDLWTANTKPEDSSRYAHQETNSL